MERLLKIGTIKAKQAHQIRKSRLGIGFEKLDRAVFDPEKAYNKVAAIGVKWIRIQSGWARTEKEKGIYDFSWLDNIVDNILARGMKPWICLCYGNPLYSSFASVYFGAVGCPPIATEEERTAWVRYVSAVAAHYRGKVEYYEIWNEPDSRYSWKHAHAEDEPEPGPNALEYAMLANLTADAVHEADPNAKVVGFAIAQAYQYTYMNTALAAGMAERIDALSFHAYTADDTLRPGYLKMLRQLLDSYRPGIEIIQSETGAQSRSDGSGALAGLSWTPEKQMKHQLRNLLHDLASDVTFTSYFSTMDMIEALRGLVSDKKSYLDYGYFGVLSADFDENGFSTGSYTPKPSYRSLQVLTALFSEDFLPKELPVRHVSLPSQRVKGNDCDDKTIVVYTFARDNGAKAIVYWNAVPLLTQTYEGTISFQTFGMDHSVHLIDLADGCVYTLPAEMVKDAGAGEIQLINVPISDTPKMLVFGDMKDEMEGI